MRPSEHFSYAELTINKAGRVNDPNDDQFANAQELAENVLEKIRANFGAVSVTSWFRNPEVNKAAGGAANSQHLQGMAADIHCASVSNSELWHWIVANLDFDQCIAELHSETNGRAGWVHVSYRDDGKNRKQPISFLGKGKYVPGYKYA